MRKRATPLEASHTANVGAFLTLAGLLVDKGLITRSEIAERLRVAAAEADRSDAGLAAGSVLAGMARFFEPDPPASLS